MKSPVKNILFIMCDQLRADHLSCFGHPRLHTPNLDRLAARGVIFDRAYVNSPVCGPSRMSYYTGRYVHSHGASWNFVPLKAGEMTIGDHLRPLGVRSVLVGKTHMRADLAGMSRLGIDPQSQIGVRIAECGFDPYERDDGIHPYSGHDPDPSYSDYLRRNGFDGDNPWETWANSTEDEDGTLRSGWFLKYSNRPARIPDEHSETPYITRRAMDFIREAGEQPWCLHLSYIKPHWPYIVPEPYASMYTAEDALPVVRSEAERENPHPVYAAMMDHRVSQTFSRDGVREAVMPGYMGLIKQIDDQMGVLFQFLEDQGLMDKTMIVFTADHGDYLGDHWMGEKDLFHEPVIKAPLIVYDPDPRADATRGTRCQALVEAVDIAPTFLDNHAIGLGSNVGLSDCTLIGHDAVVALIEVCYGKQLDSVGFIDIKDNCFVGHGAIVMPRVTIGPDSVVAAGSVVTKDVPPGTVVGGNPARFICTTAEMIQRVEERCNAYPWIDLIKKREGAYDPALEPMLAEVRRQYFFGDNNNG